MSECFNHRDILESICKQIKTKHINFNENVLSDENIFSILNIVNKEVMYCRVLKHLIETNWDSFKNDVLLSNEINETELKDSGLKRVELEYECDSPCEHYSKKGRIDILIETDKQQIIVIETKVYADDQEHQLFRYKKEIENHFKGYSYYIFYLTLDGHEPNKESLMCENHNKKTKICDIDKNCLCVDEQECICISFYNIISKWLENIISDFDTNSIAKQFWEVINMAKNNYDKEIGLLGENVDFAKTVLALSEAFPAFWENLINKFFEALAKKLNKDYKFQIKPQRNETYKRETLAYTLEKEDKLLYFCYETNFFFRTGFEDEDWEYVDKSVFDTNDLSKTYFGTRRRIRDAFNVKSYSSSSEKLLEWFYWDDKKKDLVIEKIADTANEFFEKSISK